jgi:hypothetical protein
VYRREVTDKPARYQVVGLWGGANVLAEQQELFTGGDYTAWSMWDGHALFGPRRPGGLEHFPGLLEIVSLGEFLDRYREGAETCEVWSKEEVLGRDCKDACQNAGQVCPELSREACMGVCANEPRSIADCTILADSCHDLSYCLDMGKSLME